MVAYKTKTTEQIDIEIEINCKHGEFTIYDSIMDKQLSFVILQLLTSTKKSVLVMQ